MAVEKGNIQFVKLLLEREEIDVNMTSVLKLLFFIEFHN